MGVTLKYNDKLNILGDVIRTKRLAQEMTLETLSNKLCLMGINITADSLYQIENNTRSIKDFELAGISSILDISVEQEFKKFIDSIK